MGRVVSLRLFRGEDIFCLLRTRARYNARKGRKKRAIEERRTKEWIDKINRNNFNNF